MATLSDYEKNRIKNIAENKRILAELGFDKPFTLSFQNGPLQKRKRPEKAHKNRKKQCTSIPELKDAGEGRPRTRRSARLSRKEPQHFQGLGDGSEDEKDRPKKAKVVKENVFGHIPGIEVGTSWISRADCGFDGVHRMTVAGIHGNGEDGCYSVALSGGYEDDIDYGECFTYTGAGGRDLKGTKSKPKNLRTAPQSKDQTLTKGNKSLIVSIGTRKPVRVIRGYKLNSPFAPEEGYRYDGVYTVEKYWQAIGASGFKVYKYALKRCEDQAPPPWKTNLQADNSKDNSTEID